MHAQVWKKPLDRKRRRKKRKRTQRLKRRVILGWIIPDKPNDLSISLVIGSRRPSSATSGSRLGQFGEEVETVKISGKMR